MRVPGDIHQNVAQDPIHQPSGNRALLGTGDLAKRDLQLVQAVRSRFIDTWSLAGGSDEDGRKGVGKRGMIQPIGDHAAEQVGPAKERAVGGGGSAQHEMIAAAGAGMAPIQHEFFGAQARLARVFIERGGVRHQLLPIGGGMDVHFDDAGIGRHFNHAQARIVRRRVALDDHRHFQMRGGVFDGRQQVDIVFGHRQRRHEHEQTAVASLDAQGGAHDPRRRFGQRRACDHGRIVCVIAGAERHWEPVAAGRAAERDSPWDRRDSLRALPPSQPRAGSAAEDASQPENRRASGTGAGRAASTARSAIRGRSNQGRVEPGARSQWAYRARARRPCGGARVRPRHLDGCPRDRR